MRYFIAYLSTLLFFCQLEAHSGVFVDGAALYWQAQEGGLSYAIKDGKRVEAPHFEWDFGFKVGLGYQVPHDTWKVALRYTSLQTHADSVHDGEVFIPLWLAPKPGPAPFSEFVKMHWRLHLGILDALLSKEIFTSEYMTWTPEIGIRTAWIRQKFNIENRGGNISPDLIRTKNKFWGIGPEAGLSGQWFMSKEFCLFAHGAGSILYGEFYLHQDEDTLDTKEKLLGIHYIFRTSAPIVELMGGLRWQHDFAGALKQLTLELAWDQYIFFSQNQLMRFNSDTELGSFTGNQGDLSIWGPQFAFCLQF